MVATRVVNIRDEAFDVLCQRPGKWGNPFVVGRDGSRSEVILKHGLFLAGHPRLIAQVRRRQRERFIHPRALLRDIDELRGKRLGCGCKPKSCHCDILAAMAETFGDATECWDICWDQGSASRRIRAIMRLLA